MTISVTKYISNDVWYFILFENKTIEGDKNNRFQKYFSF